MLKLFQFGFDANGYKNMPLNELEIAIYVLLEQLRARLGPIKHVKRDDYCHKFTMTFISLYTKIVNFLFKILV